MSQQPLDMTLRRREPPNDYRICVQLQGAAGELDNTRLLLVADLLRRIVEELHGRNTVLVIVTGGRQQSKPHADQTIRIRPDVLQIKVAQLSTESADAAIAFSGGSYDAVVVAERPPERVAGRQIIRVEPVTTSGGVPLPEIVADLVDEDPLALRLALLRFRYDRRAELSRARAHRAVETLQRWRFKVAGWHDMPRTKPAQQLLAMHRALATNLDSATVLTLMHRIETDPRQPSGYKYTAFREIDRILALNLGYLIGKRRG